MVLNQQLLLKIQSNIVDESVLRYIYDYYNVNIVVRIIIMKNILLVTTAIIILMKKM